MSYPCDVQAVQAVQAVQDLSRAQGAHGVEDSDGIDRWRRLPTLAVLLVFSYRIAHFRLPQAVLAL
jgi:hypothetical protein